MYIEKHIQVIELFSHRRTTDRKIRMSLRGQTVLLVCSQVTLNRHKLTCLQTGASMGIGEAIARALAKSDANMILISRSEVSHQNHDHYQH